MNTTFKKIGVVVGIGFLILLVSLLLCILQGIIDLLYFILFIPFLIVCAILAVVFAIRDIVKKDPNKGMREGKNGTGGKTGSESTFGGGTIAKQPSSAKSRVSASRLAAMPRQICMTCSSIANLPLKKWVPSQAARPATKQDNPPTAPPTRKNEVENNGEDASVNASDEDGDTVLHSAAKIGDKDVVEAFIRAGADVNTKNNDGRTPLHLAVCEGHKDVVEVLIRGGADVNARDSRGITPLRLAKISRNKEVFELLKRYGAEK